LGYPAHCHGAAPDAEKAQLEIRYGPPEHIKSAIEAAFDAPAAVQDHAIGVLRNASR